MYFPPVFSPVSGSCGITTCSMSLPQSFDRLTIFQLELETNEPVILTLSLTLLQRGNCNCSCRNWFCSALNGSVLEDFNY